MADASEAEAFNYPLHAMSMIERFSERIASRPPLAASKREHCVVLRTPQCGHDCNPCVLECAIAPDRLVWWERELARACGSSTMGRA
jgi:hypothetical protein